MLSDSPIPLRTEVLAGGQLYPFKSQRSAVISHEIGHYLANHSFCNSFLLATMGVAALLLHKVSLYEAQNLSRELMRHSETTMDAARIVGLWCDNRCISLEGRNIRRQHCWTTDGTEHRRGNDRKSQSPSRLRGLAVANRVRTITPSLIVVVPC